MAVCDFCKQEMLDCVSCTWNAGSIPVRELECHDCKAPVDGFHHPGCDSERCPHCHWQRIGDHLPGCPEGDRSRSRQGLRDMLKGGADNGD